MKRDSEIFVLCPIHFSLLERPNRHVYASGLFMGLLRANTDLSISRSSLCNRESGNNFQSSIENYPSPYLSFSNVSE